MAGGTDPQFAISVLPSLRKKRWEMREYSMRLFGRAVLGLGSTVCCTARGQDVDDSHVNILRAVRVTTMDSHAICLRLQQPHCLFVQGHKRIERVMAGQFHGQLPLYNYSFLKLHYSCYSLVYPIFPVFLTYQSAPPQISPTVNPFGKGSSGSSM